MTLKHYTCTPFVFRKQQYRQPVDFKPKGLWLSVEGEDDWEHWCIAEDYGLGKFVYTVTLRKKNRVLFLRTPSAIRDFTTRYRVVRYPGDRLGIDWPAIAREFSGIIIEPYQWSLRHNPQTFWYYTWDCASGCIWDLDDVAEVAPVDDEPKLAGTVNSASPDSSKEPEGSK